MKLEIDTPNGGKVQVDDPLLLSYIKNGQAQQATLRVQQLMKEMADLLSVDPKAEQTVTSGGFIYKPRNDNSMTERVSGRFVPPGGDVQMPEANALAPNMASTTLPGAGVLNSVGTHALNLGQAMVENPVDTVVGGGLLGAGATKAYQNHIGKNTGIKPYDPTSGNVMGRSFGFGTAQPPADAGPIARGMTRAKNLIPFPRQAPQGLPTLNQGNFNQVVQGMSTDPVTAKDMGLTGKGRTMGQVTSGLGNLDPTGRQVAQLTQHYPVTPQVFQRAPNKAGVSMPMANVDGTVMAQSIKDQLPPASKAPSNWRDNMKTVVADIKSKGPSGVNYKQKTTKPDKSSPPTKLGKALPYGLSLLGAGYAYDSASTAVANASRQQKHEAMIKLIESSGGRLKSGGRVFTAEETKLILDRFKAMQDNGTY